MKPNIIFDFYEFAKKYVSIIDKKGNPQSFSKIQLKRIKQMEEIMKKGYKLNFIRSRRGNRIGWVRIL